MTPHMPPTPAVSAKEKARVTSKMIDAAFRALPPDALGTIAAGEMERILTAAGMERDSVDEAVARAAILAYESAKQKGEAEGWVLVPREPTTSMLAAGQTAWLADPCRKSSTLYRAMIAATPEPPTMLSAGGEG